MADLAALARRLDEEIRDTLPAAEVASVEWNAEAKTMVIKAGVCGKLVMRSRAQLNQTANDFKADIEREWLQELVDIQVTLAYFTELRRVEIAEEDDDPAEADRIWIAMREDYPNHMAGHPVARLDRLLPR
jgi:hypothetical protein